MSADPFKDADLPEDPFDDKDDPTVGVISEPVNEVHIRIQQRNGKKCLTLVQGLPPKLNLKKVMQYFKKNFCCNGTIVEDDAAGRVLQLTGDQRKVIADFLINEKICRKEQVKIHGVL
ncbi:Translation initiation factor SUI1 family protein [Tritrichomonas foetus]|uniref:Translation initiation factor SUI1 family protein n=1 Tax=Tritrichomonas foetus TaxID=1144522 RepID=A0A1J4KQ75_9EUKA|nr:Translation initiation factor SUI1 family protein [Tritrichomonas foetus]|eukprot:OHT11846.1 Translation initiation factor SUI1 family protein [Tritrichomonas foetus]